MARNPLTDPEWAPELADNIERVVGLIRTTATDRVVGVVRALVFSIVIGITVLTTVTLAVILATRFLQTLFEIFTDADTAVWLSYIVMAGVLFLAGVICMHQRRPKDLAL
jgi:hypothetical protein